MSETLHKYFEKIDTLKDKIEDDSELILKRIDLDELLKSPSEYLLQLGSLFFEAHGTELRKAIDVGESTGKAMLGEIKKR